MALEILHDLTNPASTFGGLFYAVVFGAAAWLITRSIRRTVMHVLKRDKDERIDRTAAHFVTRLTQIAVFVIALLFYAHLIPALRSLGTALLAGFGLASVVIALAAQNTLGNLIAGISLLLYRPFKVGDLVQLNTPKGLDGGTLETLALGYTVVRTFDNRRIVVPNSVMASQVTINLSEPRMMAVVDMGLSYSSDIDHARQVMEELARDHPLVQEVVGCPVAELGGSGVGLSLRAWCRSAGDAAAVKSDLYEKAKKRFDKEGIGLAFASTNVVVTHARETRK